MRIVLVILHKFWGKSGGMEKVCCSMANELTKRGHKIAIFMDNEKDGHPFFPVSENVCFYNAAKLRTKKIAKAPLPAKIIREMIRPFNKQLERRWQFRWDTLYYTEPIQRMMTAFNPDVVISFTPRFSSFMFSNYNAQIHAPIITMFHFSVDFAADWGNSRIIDALKKSSYSQVLTKIDWNAFKEKLPDSPVIYIPNIVPQYTMLAHPGGVKSTYRIINVARLDKIQKRQHLLIEAFILLKNQFPNWTLEIWGDSQNGMEYPKALEMMIHHYKMENQVKLCGHTDNVHELYINADIFAFPSAYEGFPLAMTEAMSAGLPVVAYKSCEAVNDIIENGHTGFLAEDGVKSFAENLKMLMESPSLRVEIGTNAHEEMKKFSPEIVWNQWESILYKTITNR